MLVAQSCLTLCDPVDCSPPGLSVRGILRTRILEWVAIPFSRGSSPPRDRTHATCIWSIGLPGKSQWEVLTSKWFQLFSFFSDLSLIIVFLSYLKLHGKQQVFVHLKNLSTMHVPFFWVLITLSGGFDIFSVSNFSVCYIIFQNIWNSTGKRCWKQFPLCEKSKDLLK